MENQAWACQAVERLVLDAICGCCDTMKEFNCVSKRFSPYFWILLHRLSCILSSYLMKTDDGPCQEVSSNRDSPARASHLPAHYPAHSSSHPDMSLSQGIQLQRVCDLSEGCMHQSPPFHQLSCWLPTCFSTRCDDQTDLARQDVTSRLFARDCPASPALSLECRTLLLLEAWLLVFLVGLRRHISKVLSCQDARPAPQKPSQKQRKAVKACYSYFLW